MSLEDLKTRYYIHLLDDKIQTLTVPNVGDDMEQRELSFITNGI
jgi:hypothetical protein